MATPPGTGEFNSTTSPLGSPTPAPAGLVQQAYDRYVEFALRTTPLIRQVADKRPVAQAMPGSSVVLQLYKDLAPATAELAESVDPDAVALDRPDHVTVTLREYGNASLTTRKLNLFSLADVDPAIADIIAYNMADSIDLLADSVLRTGKNVIREAGGNLALNSGATNAVDAGDTIKSRDFRAAVAKLRGNKAVPRKGQYYWAAVHPDVSMDLRAETGPGGWRTPQEYGAGDGLSGIWAGELGAYEGAFFVESPRLFSAKDGKGGTRVYRSYVAGKQALAEAVAEEPHTVIGPVVDKLMRFRPIGWYGVLGFALYREDSLFRIESSASIPMP